MRAAAARRHLLVLERDLPAVQAALVQLQAQNDGALVAALRAVEGVTVPAYLGIVGEGQGATAHRLRQLDGASRLLGEWRDELDDIAQQGLQPYGRNSAALPRWAHTVGQARAAALLAAAAPTPLAAAEVVVALLQRRLAPLP